MGMSPGVHCEVSAVTSDMLLCIGSQLHSHSLEPIDGQQSVECNAFSESIVRHTYKYVVRSDNVTNM